MKVPKLPIIIIGIAGNNRTAINNSTPAVDECDPRVATNRATLKTIATPHNDLRTPVKINDSVFFTYIAYH